MLRSAVRLLVVILLAPHYVTAEEPGVIQTAANSVGADFLWAGRTVVEDAKDIATAPLHIAELRNVTTEQLLIGALALGSIGGTIALDQTIRARAKSIGTHDGRLLETTGSTVSLSSIPVLYVAGLATGNEEWRHGALTGVESFGLTSGLVAGVQAGFGRQRPNADKGAYTWFDGGTSFVSSATAPAFAAAESVSAAVDHDWRVTLPLYAAATAVGVGRMAQDAHWASDIVGAAWLAVGTTQTLRHLHSHREQQGVSWSIDPVAAAKNGMGLAFNLRF
jgi:membrane-associated phospholipid phosphatase